MKIGSMEIANKFVVHAAGEDVGNDNQLVLRRKGVHQAIHLAG